MKNILLLSGLIGISVLSNPKTLEAQSAAFTYQGTLQENGVPANSTQDLTFTLYPVATGGTALAPSRVFNDVSVTNGLITVNLDFGANVFNGEERWLQIGVRPGSSSGNYTTLTPRQKIMSTPYALFAGGTKLSDNSVTTSMLANGSVTSAKLGTDVGAWTEVGGNVYRSGKLGLGTEQMDSVISIANIGGVNGVKMLGFGEGGQSGFFFSSGFAGSDGNNYISLATDIGGTIDRMIFKGDGKVGIGRSIPNYPLCIESSAGQWLGLKNPNGQTQWHINDLGGIGFNIAQTGIADARIIIANNGNVGIGERTPASRLHVAGEITCTAINITSDRNAKNEFRSVNSMEVLEKLASLDISEWQYKAHPGIRHIGPMAQDFHAAFSTGKDDKHITTVDADGVALAAIQGLNKKLSLEIQVRDQKIADLEQSLVELKQIVRAIAREKSSDLN